MRSQSRSIALPATGVLLACCIAHAAPLPAEFESAGENLLPLFAYFGGVAGISVVQSTHVVHSGLSESVVVDWKPDPNFSRAGAAIGDRLISGTDLDVPVGASYFSFSMQAPLTGQFSIEVVLREDDNGDGVIDPLGADDEWRSERFLLEPGRVTYNVSLASLFDANPEGNGVQGFETTTAVGLELIIETRDAYAGGIVETPAEYMIDHVRFSVGGEQLPAGVAADFDLSDVVDGADLATLLAGWGSPGATDLTADGVTDGADLAIVLAAWGPLQ